MLPRQHPTSSAPGPADPSSADNICRKFIWGTCDKYAQCKYRHELDSQRMKDILQFCHDYQNTKSCTRQNCKFLHATKEEQSTFVATGQIPRVLAERHAAMAAAASNMQTNAETIPQIAMFISESYMSQPPPAPWPPLPPPPAALPPVATAPPPPPPSSPPRHAAHQSVPPAQQPPPPPAPTSSAQLRPAPTTYAAVPQSPSVLFTVNQPPPLVPPNFDATRPPPPIPSHMQASNNGQQLKRKIDANGNAGTSKIRKPEGPEVSEVHCESCVQRELRIDGYKQQMEALHNEEETQILLYKKKLQEYEIGRDILQTIVGPELFTVFDNLIEGAQTSQLDNPGSSFITGSPTVSKQALLQLFQMLLGGGTRNVIDPVPSTSHMDETLQSLTSISRRHNVASYSNTGPDIIKFVVETLRNSSGQDRSPPVEERPTEPTDINRGSNGYATNGQKCQPSTSEPVRFGAAAGYSAPSVQRPEFGPRAHATMPSYSVAGPSGYSAVPTPVPPPPQAYPMYHPAVPPPPNRQYYPQNVIPGAPNMPYNGTERAPVPSHGMQPPASAALRPAVNAPNYNYMGRYPQPPYFPPYQ